MIAGDEESGFATRPQKKLRGVLGAEEAAGMIPREAKITSQLRGRAASETLSIQNEPMAIQITRPTDEVGASVTIESEPTPATHEAELVGTEQECQSERSSARIVPPSLLYESINALMSNEDLEKAAICTELYSFASFLNMMIDKVLHKGLPFHTFRPLLDQHVMDIREEGYADLANCIAADLTQLEQELQELKKLWDTGASSYISAHIESGLKAWHDAQAYARLKLQKVRSRVDQMRASLEKKAKTEADLLQSLESNQAEIARLEKALEDAKNARAIMGDDLTGVENACAKMLEKIKPYEEKLAEAKKEVAKALTTTEDSVKAELEVELVQAYEEKLSRLEEQIRHRQLPVE